MKPIIITSFFVFLLFSGMSQSCLPEGIIFGNQYEVDQFQDNYPGCIEIEGFVTISGADITDLTGLEVLTAIGGDLNIGDAFAPNLVLADLNGLNNIESIGGSLNIMFNGLLSDINGLEGLTELTGLLFIIDNAILPSLSGLDNLDGTLLAGIYIMNNPQLSQCDVEGICEYLQAPPGAVVIEDNATGCANNAQVYEACGSIGVDERSTYNSISVFPNPVSSETATVRIMNSEMPFQGVVQYLNIFGEIQHQEYIDGRSEWPLHVDGWPLGIYIVVVNGDSYPYIIKFVIL